MTDTPAGRAIPSLSVVIGTRRPLSELTAVLAALGPQLAEVDGELVIAGGALDAGMSLPPRVRHLPTTETDILRLRARAVHAARGALVAIGEDHAVPAPDWCQAIVRAHAAHPDVPAVVGCLRNATDATVTGRANFLAFAAPYAPPMPELPARPPPSSTLSLKRDVLAGSSENGELETRLLVRLFEERRMVADDRIVVEHHQDHGLWWSVRNAYWSTRAAYGYARDRDPTSRWQVARWVAAHVSRRHWREARAARSRAGSPGRDLPTVALIVAAGGLGAVVGALAGPGAAPRRTS